MSSDRLAGRKTLKVASFLEEFEKEEESILSACLTPSE